MQQVEVRRRLLQISDEIQELLGTLEGNGDDVKELVFSALRDFLQDWPMQQARAADVVAWVGRQGDARYRRLEEFRNSRTLGQFLRRHVTELEDRLGIRYRQQGVSWMLFLPTRTPQYTSQDRQTLQLLRKFAESWNREEAHVSDVVVWAKRQKEHNPQLELPQTFGHEIALGRFIARNRDAVTQLSNIRVVSEYNQTRLYPQPSPSEATV